MLNGCRGQSLETMYAGDYKKQVVKYRKESIGTIKGVLNTSNTNAPEIWSIIAVFLLNAAYRLKWKGGDHEAANPMQALNESKSSR